MSFSVSVFLGAVPGRSREARLSPTGLKIRERGEDTYIQCGMVRASDRLQLLQPTLRHKFNLRASRPDEKTKFTRGSRWSHFYSWGRIAHYLLRTCIRTIRNNDHILKGFPRAATSFLNKRSWNFERFQNCRKRTQYEVSRTDDLIL